VLGDCRGRSRALVMFGIGLARDVASSWILVSCLELAASGEMDMGIKRRTRERRKRLVAYRAGNFKDAEQWDLRFWQNQTPEMRLSALVAIRDDVAKVEKARRKSGARS
jgi:hypothetical protein